MTEIDKDLELYIHIPFCVRKCAYCDFLSAPADDETRHAYVQALLKELKGRSSEASAYTVKTVFFGGGTPSVLDPGDMAALMEQIRFGYALAEDAEITMEVNPGTLKPGAAKIYRQAGINRLSIGLQSCQDEELKRLGRIHSYAQFLETYRQAVDAGFTNISVDLMSALPGQTAESYRDSLQKVVSLDPPPTHISAYSLIIEEGTPFAESYEKGELELSSEDTERAMYEETEQFLAGYGYRRYEISNYAVNGKVCRHNAGYWKRVNYLGFGIGAASLMENVRFTNDSDLQAYVQDPMGQRGDRHKLDEAEQMEEFMFLGLRMTEGISVRKFEDLFQRSFEKVYGEVTGNHIQNGLLHYTDTPEGDRYLALTSRGLDLANYVMSDYLEPMI